MNKITYPLTPGMQGPDVANLQEALAYLLERRGIRTPVVEGQSNERELAELAARLSEERSHEHYGDATQRLVLYFQLQQGFGERLQGHVERRTADLLNQLLEALGLLTPGNGMATTFTDTRFTVLCRVEDARGEPIAGLHLEAYHEDNAAPRQPLGQATTTDEQGTATFRFQRSDFTQHPDVGGPNLHFHVYRGDQQLDYTLPGQDSLEGMILDFQPQREPLVLQVARHYVVSGRVVQADGQPARQLQLIVQQLAFGGAATELGWAFTNDRGEYALAYDPGTTAVNLEIRMPTPQDGQQQSIPLMKPRFGAAPLEVINLTVPVSTTTAEYQRLSADLLPHIEDMSRLAKARENAERQDLSVLNRSTGWDARLIAMASLTERLSADQDLNLPSEAVYGLLRAGLPSDKNLLAQVTPDVAEQALKSVRDAGIVALTNDQITAAKDQFETFRKNTRLQSTAPGSTATYGDLLKTSGLSEAAQETFATVYLNHRGSATQLWDAAKQAGLDDQQIGRLQLQGKLAFLAGNSAGMTQRLMNKRVNGAAVSDPSQLVGEKLYRADAWTKEIMAQAGVPENRRDNLSEEDKQKLAALIPPTYPGEQVTDRLETYAADMARKIRLSYPTQVIAHRMETDAAFRLPEAHDATVKLLKELSAQGFQLGRTPVNTFMKTHSNGTNTRGSSVTTVTQRQLQGLQRAYQLTPSDEAMAVLLAMGLDAAYDITAYTQEMFEDLYISKYVELYGKQPPDDEPRLIYRKATQVNSVTYNLFAIAKKMDSEPPVAGLSAPVEVRESVRNELIKHLPTMESLFGSMDFCECEHCRSVLSPAAYLVDLLQFIDPEAGVWGNFLASWKKKHQGQEYPHRDADGKPMKPYDVLLERRPDLPHIPLTCENTHTTMPYIDIVNEILEYYVANDKLTKEAAQDTGGATSAELLSEPQNVIREAYDRLRSARYPIGLPFDLPLETVRRFCQYFELPFDRLLEVFRPGDELLAPTRPYDRAAIFMESLGLSPAEAALFTDPDPLSGNKWYALYGFPTNAPAPDIEALRSAKALSRRLGITYKEMIRLVQTSFVNPKLAGLTLLYKLGISIQDARLYNLHRAFYEQHKDLIGKQRNELSAADQKRFDDLKDTVPTTSLSGWEIVNEVEAIRQRLTALSAQYDVPFNTLQQYLTDLPFAEVLVLADPDTGGNFDLTTLQYADGKAVDPITLLRINLFVRLWRKLGWSMAETDRALTAFIPRSAPYDGKSENLKKHPLRTALIYLAHLKMLNGQLKVGKQSLLKLLTLWTDIPTTGKQSLYAQLFLTRTALKSGEVEILLNGQPHRYSVFDDLLGRYLLAEELLRRADQVVYEVSLADTAEADRINEATFAGEPRIGLRYDALSETQYLSYHGLLSAAEKTRLAALAPSDELSQLLDAVQRKGMDFTLIRGHITTLQGALGLTATEIDSIIADAGLGPDTTELSLPNVSLLYRYSLLARALKLTIRELIALKQLSGLNPFKALSGDPLSDLAQDHPFGQTLRFIDIAGQVKESGFSIEELEYLLRHRFDETGPYRPDREILSNLMRTLAEGIRKLRAEHAVPADPAAVTEEVLREKLSLILPAEVVDRQLSMMNGTVQWTVSKNGVAEADALKPAELRSEPAIVDASYQPARQEQKLTVRPFHPERADLEQRHPSALLAELLQEADSQARSFFDRYLKKQKISEQGEAGFLEGTDYKGLFEPFQPLVKINPADTPEVMAQKQQTNTERLQARQVSLRNRRNRIAQVFFPYLQQQLIRQFIIEKLTAHFGADPALLAGLLSDSRLLSTPETLLDVIKQLGHPGMTLTYYATADATGPALLTEVVTDADTGLRDAEGDLLRPATAKSARFDAWLEVPASGAYRFYAEIDDKNTQTQLRFGHQSDNLFAGKAEQKNDVLGDQPAEFIDLKPGIPYHFTFVVRNLGSGQARLRVQGEQLLRGSLSLLRLYPAPVISQAEQALLLLSKPLLLIERLGLTEREVRYLLTHPEAFDGLNWSDLPTRPEDDTLLNARRLFAQWLRLINYTRLRRDIAGGSDRLIEVFEAPAADDAYAIIARLTRRPVLTVKTTARALFDTPTFREERSLQRLWEALQIVEMMGVPIASLLSWTDIVQADASGGRRFAIARDVREAIKARFEPEAWQRVAQAVFDQLRRRQRDALVAYVMHQHGFARLEQLYEYFLIDPGMEPVVQTSRIRLAIATVQLFIQRSLLNLEVKVHPSLINSQHWDWMKRYRVWEANRKIFLFPENWLEPEFRDDKTHLFTELEGALLQGDVTDDLVEDAFLNYLKKLDELARLDIVGMHIEDNFDPARRVLHVIGRTYSQPHKYFYRRYRHQMWTPWEPVSAEIEGNHLAPVVWRNRLFLFWVTFLDKAEAPPPTAVNNEWQESVSWKVSQNDHIKISLNSSSKKEAKVTDMTLSQLTDGVLSMTGSRSIEVQLHWSEYLKGEWSSPESNGYQAASPMIVSGLKYFNPGGVFVHVSKAFEAGEESGVYIHLGGQINQSFYLAGRNSTPETVSYTANGAAGARPDNPYNSAGKVLANRYGGGGPFRVSFRQSMTTEPNKTPAKVNPNILEKGGNYTLLPCNNNLSALGVSADMFESAANPTAVEAAVKSGLLEIAALIKPVFYQDRQHTFYVEPDVTEHTIEDQQNWVTKTTESDPGWTLVEPWKGLKVKAAHAWEPPVVDPLDKWQLSKEALINPVQEEDWLLNSGTALLFDQGVVGPAGSAGIEIRNNALTAMTANGGALVHTHPGSELNAGATAVLSGESTLEQSGLTQMQTGLHIVGSGGLNPAIGQQISQFNRNRLAGLTRLGQ